MSFYNPNPYMGSYQPYYGQPAPDQLAQLRMQNQQMAQPVPQQMQPQMQTASPAASGILWVANEMEAQNYPVAPNCAVALWDANSPAVYLKQADAAGKPTIKIYDLVERTAAPKMPQNAPVTLPGNYVTRDEFEALAAKFEALTAQKAASKKNDKEEA